MDKWIGKVAVVTGVSSGIGEETCRQLVKHGMIVVGFARNEHRLQELKKELKDNFYYVKVDLCSEKNILDAFQWVKVTLKSIDVLINNAGVLKLTDIFGDTQDWKLMFDTNVIGLNICSREAVKLMKEMEIKEGHIINVNSITGHYIMSGMKDFSVYGSTKFSVTALSEYLREFMSMENLPIRVTSISPGFVDTKMIEKFKFEDNTVLQTIDIADAIVYALSAPKRVNSLLTELIDMELSSGTSETEVPKLKATKVADAIVNIVSFPRNKSIKDSELLIIPSSETYQPFFKKTFSIQ